MLNDNETPMKGDSLFTQCCLALKAAFVSAPTDKRSCELAQDLLKNLIEAVRASDSDTPPPSTLLTKVKISLEQLTRVHTLAFSGAYTDDSGHSLQLSGASAPKTLPDDSPWKMAADRWNASMHPDAK